MSVRPYVHLPAWVYSARTGRIFIKFDICTLFENLSSEFMLHQNLTPITGTLHEDPRTFLTPRSVLLIKRNDSGQSYRQKLHFILTFCWPCISVYLSQYLTNLVHKICFTISFYFMPLHVSSTCAHHQEVKIALHSLWCHHTYRCYDTRSCVMQFLTSWWWAHVLETCRSMK